MNSQQRRKAFRKVCHKWGSKPKLIQNWIELALVPESPTHYIEIDEDRCAGWIVKKGADKVDYGHYLSTHTFYGNNFRQSTVLLQKCGFNVVLSNWDAN